MNLPTPSALTFQPPCPHFNVGSTRMTLELNAVNLPTSNVAGPCVLDLGSSCSCHCGHIATSMQHCNGGAGGEDSWQLVPTAMQQWMLDGSIASTAFKKGRGRHGNPTWNKQHVSVTSSCDAANDLQTAILCIPFGSSRTFACCLRTG